MLMFRCVKIKQLHILIIKFEYRYSFQHQLAIFFNQIFNFLFYFMAQSILIPLKKTMHNILFRLNKDHGLHPVDANYALLTSLLPKSQRAT